MFCSNCGAQVDDSAKICPNCGAKCGNEDFSSKVNDFTNNVEDQAKTYFNNAEGQLKDAVGEIKTDFNGGDSGEKLNDNRGLASYIILSLITCGIYSYYFIYKLAHDVNIACEGDGQETSGLVAFILLSLVTCGIYAWVWYYKLGNRLQLAGPRYQINDIQENGTTVLMWLIFGSLICGIGPFIAMHILIKNSNRIFAAYNRQHGFI